MAMADGGRDKKLTHAREDTVPASLSFQCRHSDSAVAIKAKVACVCDIIDSCAVRK